VARFWRILRWVAIGIGGVIAFGIAATLVGVQIAQPPTALGVREGRLADCPGSPNCVSTQSTDARFALEPLPYTGSTIAAQQAIVAVLRAQPRAMILLEEPTYVHALFRSPTVGFPDDVEVYLDEATQMIHFRSAARMGRGDMGVNRARMEALRAELAAALP
jgi:uncharacterized protein (DUF1499 family)